MIHLDKESIDFMYTWKCEYNFYWSCVAKDAEFGETSCIEPLL